MLIISGVKQNPGPRNTKSSSTTASKTAAAKFDLVGIGTAFAKILSNLSDLRREQMDTNTKLDSLHTTMSGKLDNVESNITWL